MLKLRIATALILAPLIIWSVLTFSHRMLAIEIGLVLTLAAWEWGRLSGVISQPARITYSLFVSLCMVGITFLLHSKLEMISTVLYVITGFWLTSLFWLIIIENTGLNVPERFSLTSIIVNLLVGLFILVGAFVALTGIHYEQAYGAKYIIVLLIIIWVADSAAYFTGKAMGKHKLARIISPGKSWEGVAGAIVAISIVSFLIASYLNIPTNQWIAFLFISIITVSFSIVGDLFESLFKRRAQLKDSSHILPGHGGIFDRIDSLVAAAPFFYLGIQVANIK